MLKDIEIQLLEILYSNRGGRALTSRMIQKGFEDYVDEREIVYHLKNLKEKRLIRTLRVAGNTKGAYKYSAYDTYEINSLGEEVVENDFKQKDSYTHQAQTIIIGEHINLGNITNIQNNTTEVINQLPISEDLRDEIRELIKEIENETSTDTINKNRLKELFKETADKGFSALTDAALNLIIKQVIG